MRYRCVYRSVIRAYFAMLLFACPLAWSQPNTINIRCEGQVCTIDKALLQALIAQATMNCGPTR